MKRILVTGVTGAVGSQLAPRLVERGWEVVCVVRAKDGQGPRERLEREFGALASRLKAVGGDVRMPLLGLSPDEISQLRGKVDAVLHCAASVSFDERDGADVWDTNVGGTGAFLDLAEAIGVSRAHLVSTAYVAGDAASFGETDFELGQQPRNPYEASKMAAEDLVRARLPDAFTIYRPSIVVGDSRTGYTRAFDGYYGFVKALHRLARALGGRQALPPGVTRTGDVLHVPLTLRSRPEATMNMIPVDWVTDAIARLMELPPSGRCYHLTHPEPVDMATVAAATLPRLGLDGVRIETVPLSDQPPAAQALQRRMDAHLERYRCYINGEPRFGHEAVRKALGPGYTAPPPMDRRMLSKLLDYAISVGFEPQPREQLVPADAD